MSRIFDALTKEGRMESQIRPVDCHSAPLFSVQSRSERTESDWERVLWILQKHWLLSLGFALAVLIATTVYTFQINPFYAPTARIEVDPPGWAVAPIHDTGNNTESSDPDYLETQAQILRSDDLALAVIRKLRLDRNPEFVDEKLLKRAGDQANEQPSDANQLTYLEAVALGTFEKGLTVTAVRNSRLIEISFSSHDPRLAAKVTNATATVFADRNYRGFYQATMQASKWLSQQLDDLRQKVEKSNQALAAFQNANGIVELGEKQNTVTQEAAELSRQISQAQADRIQLEAYLKMADAGSEDSLPQVRDNQTFQALRQRLGETRAQLAQALAIYGNKNPNVRKLQSEADELEAQLTAERKNLVGQLRTNYESAKARERLLVQALKEMKGVVGHTNEKTAQYDFLKREAQANEDLYDTLLARLKEAEISAGLKSSNIYLVDKARVLDEPTGPRPRQWYIVRGLILGILGGAALSFIKESLDHTVHAPVDIQKWTGLSFVATLPPMVSKNGSGRGLQLAGRATKVLLGNRDNGQAGSALRFFLERPCSPESEGVRNLRAAIMLSRPTQPPRVLLVASPSPREGKTTVAVNLAIALAQQGKTCLIDGDLRKAAVTQKFTGPQGLTDVLAGSTLLESVVQGVPDVENLTLLPVGSVAQNPGELVASGPMGTILLAVRQRFRYVVIDSSPLIPFADARMMATLTDGVVLVGRWGSTTREALIRSFEILKEVHAPVLGIVFNGIDEDFRYSKYYGYR
jgi:polysaccharide biosynthesis transport protein